MTQNRFPSRAEVLRRRRLRQAAASLGVEQAEPEAPPEPEVEQGKPEVEQGQDWGTPEAGETPERALISFPPKRPYWR